MVCMSDLETESGFLVLIDRSIDSIDSIDSTAEQEDYGWKLVHADVFRFPDHKVRERERASGMVDAAALSVVRPLLNHSSVRHCRICSAPVSVLERSCSL